MEPPDHPTVRIALDEGPCWLLFTLMAETYRITLVCDGVPAHAGEEAARDITEAFRDHYPHEWNVVCSFDGKSLTLVAENDYDPQGLNLMDEFSDNICAYIGAFDGDLRLVSVEIIS